MENVYIQIGVNSINTEIIENFINEGLNDLKVMDDELDGKYVKIISKIVFDKLMDYNLKSMDGEDDTDIYSYTELENMGWIKYHRDDLTSTYLYKKGNAHLIIYDSGAIITWSPDKAARRLTCLSDIIKYDEEMNKKVEI